MAGYLAIGLWPLGAVWRGLVMSMAKIENAESAISEESRHIEAAKAAAGEINGGGVTVSAKAQPPGWLVKSALGKMAQQ